MHAAEVFAFVVTMSVYMMTELHPYKVMLI